MVMESISKEFKNVSIGYFIRGNSLIIENNLSSLNLVLFPAASMTA